MNAIADPRYNTLRMDIIVKLELSERQAALRQEARPAKVKSSYETN